MGVEAGRERSMRIECQERRIEGRDPKIDRDDILEIRGREVRSGSRPDTEAEQF